MQVNTYTYWIHFNDGTKKLGKSFKDIYVADSDGEKNRTNSVGNWAKSGLVLCEDNFLYPLTGVAKIELFTTSEDIPEDDI